MSNYAKALKHIALRGRASVGLSAAENEIKLYKKSFLPPDYSPPKLDKWDDMMERWTHAWQYPVADTIETPSRHAAKEYRRNLFELADFLKLVADNPPFIKTEDDKCLPLLPKTIQPEKLTSGDSNAESTDFSGEKQSREPADAPYVELVPGEPMVEDGIPVAYLEVMAPITVYSKELAIHLADVGLSFDEDGVKTAIRALGLIDKKSDAIFLFDFGKALGLAGRSIVSYNALAATFSGNGCVQAVMDLIERAKAKGITPNIVTWNILITRMSNQGDTQGAIQVYSHMKALANIEPNEEVITAMLWVYANDNSEESTQKCLELFEQMQTTLNMIPLRGSYTAVLHALRFRQSRSQELLEIAKKMEIVGYHWSPTVYACLMTNHGCVGKLDEIKKLHAKMRENGIEMTTDHLYPIFEALRHQGDQNALDKLKFWRGHLNTAWGVIRLVQRRCASLERVEFQKRVEIAFDGMLRLLDTVIDKLLLHFHGEIATVKPLRQEAMTVYENGPYEDGQTKWGRRCHVNYMKILARFPEDRQRLTAIFHTVLHECKAVQGRASKDKLYRACVVMIKMHLKSGEEGGTRKALEYLELMENHNLFPSRQLMRQIRNIADEAAYTRDMKRRGRRMQQAKEEYAEQKAEWSAENPSQGEVQFEESNTAFDPIRPFAPQDVSSLKDFVAQGNPKSQKPTVDDYFAYAQQSAQSTSDLPPLVPVQPIEENNTAVNFWDRWTKNTISKHDLFDDAGEDAMPRGESFAEKNDALQKLGIISKFETKEAIPRPAESKLLAKLRAEGTEPTGALWAVDGSGYSYPASRTGSFGWDVTFWREKQIIKKAYEQSISSGNLSWIRNIPLSLPSVARKTVPEQLELEQTGSKTEADIADARAYPLERYDSGESKPMAEHASSVAPNQSYSWEKEKDHPLVPYMSEKEIVQEMGYEVSPIDDSDTLGAHNRHAAEDVTRRTVETLRNAPTDVIAYGAAHGMGEHRVSGYKNRKYDYLQRFQEMYQRGQLEVPDEPVVRFGRTENDVAASTAASVEAFYAATARSEEQGEGHAAKPLSQRQVEIKKMRQRQVAHRAKQLKKKGVRASKLRSERPKVEPHG